ncbi:MAG TPA: hydrogenase maturation protease [Rectinemataceae bacterium]|nr:hydrogenase maturation protease [Rectinemataceae bacterium]
MRAQRPAGCLVLCFGNPAREDDGLGPAVADYLEKLELEAVAVESDYQLRVEDALAVAESALVVFVDAAAAGEEPFAFSRLEPRPGLDYTTHSLGPAQLLGLAEEVFGRSPESYLLAIRGYSFDLFEEGLTERAQVNLEAASGFLADFLRRAAKAGAEGQGRSQRLGRSRRPSREAAELGREAAGLGGENAEGGVG